MVEIAALSHLKYLRALCEIFRHALAGDSQSTYK